MFPISQTNVFSEIAASISTCQAVTYEQTICLIFRRSEIKMESQLKENNINK